MNKVLSCIIFFFCGSFHVNAQHPAMSKEEFVNEVTGQLMDSSFSKFYLLDRAPACSFKKFDYGELLKYSLTKMIPIFELNELAKASVDDTIKTYWVQDKLQNAICIDEAKHNAIVYPLDSLAHDNSLTKKEKHKLIRKSREAWAKKPVSDKVVFSFSQPVFTGDGQYAVMNVIYDCASLYASGWTFLFSKTSGHWELAGKIFNWQTESKGLVKDLHSAP